MATTFHTRILTAEGEIFEGVTTSLIARSRDGYFGILANHAPMIASLVPGKLVLKDGNGKESVFCMSGGLLEVRDNELRILADSAELPGDIDYERACRAEERARERLGGRGQGVDLDRALLALLRAINRKKTTEEYRHV